MKQVFQNYNTGELELMDVPSPAKLPDRILIKNTNSLISAGTEKQMIDLAKKSLVGKARARPDLVKKVINKAKAEGWYEAYRQAKLRLDMPVPLGYSCAGEVIWVGSRIDGFKVGDRVACFGSGYASHAEIISVPENLCVKIPGDVKSEEAAFVGVGAIALHGVRMAGVSIGEKIAVIGLGLIGLITVQILRASGCSVFGIDIDREKVDLAIKLGADDGAVINGDGVENRMEIFSEGGADKVIICASTKSSQPVEMAGEICRDRGRVVSIGNVGMDIPRRTYFQKEIGVLVSRSAGPGIFDSQYEERGIDYPISYVRWTENRNMEAFLKLLNDKKVKLDEIITHRFDIDDVKKAYAMILGNDSEKFIGVLLSFGEGYSISQREKIQEKEITPKPEGKVNLGLIGAGLFARTTLLPAIKDISALNLKSISTATGLSAKYTGKKYGFEYGTTDYNEILSDQNIDAVMVVTGNNLHSKIVAEALRNDKYVFVEKPLAINEEGVADILESWENSEGGLMVGYNRRFSPLTRKANVWLSSVQNPLVINCRINAGYIPKEESIHDPDSGGGRIVGEVCHFVDIIQYFTGAYPVRVYAEPISGNTGKYLSQDNVAINMKMSDGSVGNIVYTAMGDKSFPRERVEVFGGGAVCVIDNFKRVWFARGGNKKEKKKWLGVERGHKEEFEEFFRAIKEGREMPVEFESYLYTTMATFAIEESLKSGTPKEVSIGSVLRG